ncbi:MAG: UvrD-helicase domain-containing protein, partial [Thermodesulfobacteriota bacterium]
MLIDASAGTGKTYTISSLVVRLLIEKELPINEILVVTYTEAAVADLKTRIREKIIAAVEAFSTGESDDDFLQELIAVNPRPRRMVQLLTLSLRNFDEAAIFTIHGFCRRVLSEHSLESGVAFDSELITDQHDLLKEITEDFFRVNFYESVPLVAAWFYKKFSPPELMKKLGAIYNRDDVRIVPPFDGGACRRELEVAATRYAEIFGELAGRWRAGREGAAGVLLDSKVLNRNRYRVKSIPGWLLAMDRLAAGHEPPAVLFDAFVKFTTTQLALGTKAGHEPPAADFFDFCETLNSARMDLAEALNNFAKYLEAELFSFTKVELEKRKAAANVHSFDDLLTDLHRALGSEGGGELVRSLATKYKAALIDEFQDTDPVQYEIFARIFRGGDSLLYLIGDPKQAIYSFRGADIFAYIRAVREVAGSRYTLGENWRSVDGLVCAVNAFFTSRRNSFVFEEILFESAKVAEKRTKAMASLEIDGIAPPSFCLQLHRRSADDDEKGRLISKDPGRHQVLSWLTSEVGMLLRKGERGAAVIGEQRLMAGDMAVLVRTNMEARLVREALGRAGINSVIHSSESLFASREAIEVRIFLEAVVDAGSGRRTRAAMATRLLSIPARDLDLGCDSDDLLSTWHEKFRKYQSAWLRSGFSVMFADFLEEEDVRARLLSLPGGERILTNVLHLLEALHLAAVGKKLGMAGLVKYLGEKIAAEEERPADELQLRLESDADLIQIVTIHKAKGLEYPVVFCPFCWEGSRLAGARQKGRSFLFHEPGEVGKLILDIGSAEAEENLLLARREEMAENMRLLYVALTRASHRCYLSWGPFKGAGTSALAYLLHGGDDSAEDEGQPLWAADYLEGLGDHEISGDVERLAAKGEGNIEIRYYSPSSQKLLMPRAT